MKCPVCKSTELVSIHLEPNLESWQCSTCRGNWIQGAAYWKWLEQHGPNLPERAEDEEGLTLAERERYLDCPECRFRMVRYLAGRGLTFNLDHCQGCKGIWLDPNEWEALKRRNLHDDLNEMLTSFWQATARRDKRKKMVERLYVSRVGAEDYAEIMRVREWLESHPHKQFLLAYLTDKDPFGI